MNNQNDDGEETMSDRKDGNDKKILLNKKDSDDEKIMLDKKGGNDGKVIPDKEYSGNDKKIMPNKKGGRNFFTTSIATVLMILAFAIVSVASYLPIRNIYFPVKDNVKNYIERSGIPSMAFDIADLTKHLQRFVNQSDIWANDRYLNIKSVKYKIYPLGENEGSEQIPEDSVSESGEETDTERDFRGKTITETTEDEANGEMSAETGKDKAVQRRSLTNMPHISDVELQAEIDNSLLYIKITFDESGRLTTEAILGDELKDKGTKFDKDSIIRHLRNEQMEQYANLEAIYIIPQDFESYDDIFTLRGIKDYYVYPGYSALILIIGAVSILILIIAASAVPYSLQSKQAICKVFNKMFLELKFLAWLVGPVGLFVSGANFIDAYSYNGYYGRSLQELIYNVNSYFYIIGIPITFTLYLLIYLGIVYIKYIYYTGFKEGFIENSLFGKISLYFIRKIRKTFKKVMAIDLREDNQRRLIGIAVMNFLVIVILGSGGFWGFIFAAIYSIIVFKYMLGLIENAVQLNQASAQVSAGNFDIKVNENMGILAPMAKNLNNIKQGFSVAVDKEIKSERMKTELISNVSHDLKTPLTSIITYVDLLKNEDVESDTQKEYIDVIDRKSRRLKILIEDLFEASKATSGNVDLNPENIDVIALFRQTLGELEEKINESNLQFRINAPENKVMCNLDGKRTYRVFENIISNILKYSMENSRVYIDVVENEKSIRFIFKNISSYEMNFDPSEIAERFTRGDKSRSTEGSGLGLSIAKSFVELQGGGLDIVIDGDLFKLTVKFPKV